MSEQTGRLTGIFDLDLSPLERGLSRARRMMRDFDDDDAAAELSLNQRPFDRGLQNARRKLSDLSDEEGEVDVGANLNPLSRGLSRARGMLSRMRGARADVTVGANTAAANTNLANVRRFVRNLNGSRASVSVAANGAPQANAQLASVQRFAANLNGRRAAVNVSAAGAPGALMVMGAVSRAAGSLNGRNAIVNIGTRGAAGAIASMVAVGAAARTLGAAVQMGTQQGINRFNKAALFMSNVAAYGMRLALFGLVGAFGPLVGMAGVAASAVASVGAGFGLLGLAAIPTMRALTTEGAKLTASQKALKAEAKGFYSAFERAFAPATTRVEQLATATMSYTRGALKPLGVTAKATADAVGRAGANMRKQFDDPRQLALFNEFLSRVPNMTRLFTQAAGQFSLGIFNMLTAAQPVAQDFLRYLNRITLQFSKWSSSAEGQQQMRQFFESVVPVAKALGRAIASVTAGLFKLTTQPAVIGFFTKLLNAITFIGERIQPALTPLFQGLNRMATLFAKIPEPIRSAATTAGIFTAAVGLLAGGPLIILGSIIMRVVSAFRLLSAPISKLTPLFAKIGPLFAKVGPALTKVGNALRAVAPFFTKLGGAFMRIVPLVARFVPWIARIALIGAIANPIGLVVTAITLLGTAFVIAYRRSETFRNAVAAVGNFIRSVAVGAFRALVNAARSVWQWFQKLPMPIQALISPLGFLIANFGRVKAALGTAAAAVGRFIARLAVGAVRVFGTVLRVLWNAAKPVVTWLGQAAMAVGRFIARLAVQRVRQYGAVLKFLWNMAKPVVQWLGKAAMAVGKFIARLVAQRVRQYGNVLRFLWQMAKPVIQWLGRAAAAVGRFVARLAVGAVRVFGRVLAAIWKAAQPVVNWIGRAAGAVGRFIARLAVGAVRLFGRVIGAIWRAAKPVVQWLGKAAVAAGKFITRLDGLSGVRLFGRLLKTLWNAAKPVVQWLGKAAASVGRFLARLAVKGLRLFVNGLRAIWNGAKTLIKWIGDAANAVGRFVTRGRESTATLRGVWGRFWSGLGKLWGQMSRRANKVTSDIQRWYTQRSKDASDRWMSRFNGLRDRYFPWLADVNSRVKRWGGNIADTYRNRSNDASDRWMDRFNRLKNGQYFPWLTDVWKRVGRWGGNVADVYQNRSDDAGNRWMKRMNRLKDGQYFPWMADVWNRVKRWGGNIVDVYRNRSDDAASRWMERMRSMKDGLFTLFGNIVDRTKTFGSNFAKAIGNGVKSGVNAAIGFFNGLGNAIEKLAGFIKLDISVPNIPKLARGGVTEYARGGVEKGKGQLTNGVTAIAGEAGRESIVPHTRWTPEGQRAYDAVPSIYRDRSHLAGRHGKRDTPPMTDRGVSSPPSRGSHSHVNDQMPMSVLKKKSQGTRGAHPDFSQNHKNVYDYVKKRADDVASKVGGVSWNTYHHHITAPGANEHSSVDFWAPGGPGAAIGKSKGDKTANYVVNNHAAGNLGTIWNRQVSTGGGWRGFGGGPHLDHVHVGWSTDPDAKIVKGGGVGGFFSGVMDALGNAYNSVKDFMAQRWNPPAVPNFSAQGKFGEVLSGASGKLLSGAKDWAMKKAEEMLSFGSDSSSGGPGLSFEGKNNRDLGKKMNEAMGWGGQWGSLDKLWQKESGWSHTAQNPTSSAYGIPQAMVSAHSMPKGYGPPGGDPKVQIDWGLGYIKERYGDPNAAWGHSQRVGWYEKGGVVPGVGPKSIMAHGGERVLSADLNQGFEALATSIDTWNSRGGTTPSVDVGGRDGSYEELLEEVRGLREEVRHQTRTVPAATGAAVKGSVDDNLKNDRRTRDAVDDGQGMVAARRRASGRKP